MKIHIVIEHSLELEHTSVLKAFESKSDAEVWLINNPLSKEDEEWGFISRNIVECDLKLSNKGLEQVLKRYYDTEQEKYNFQVGKNK